MPPAPPFLSRDDYHPRDPLIPALFAYSHELGFRKRAPARF